MADYGRAPQVVLHALGARARELRLLRELRQSDLARRAGLGVRTVERFERTGMASIENVLRIAIALGADAAFDQLFAPPPYASLDDALSRPSVGLGRRRRAPRRR